MGEDEVSTQSTKRMKTHGGKSVHLQGTHFSTSSQSFLFLIHKQPPFQGLGPLDRFWVQFLLFLSQTGHSVELFYFLPIALLEDKSKDNRVLLERPLSHEGLHCIVRHSQGQGSIVSQYLWLLPEMELWF